MKSKSDSDSLIEKFRKTKTQDYPDFYSLHNPLEKGLWVLHVAKETKIANQLKAVDIASIIVDVLEESIKPRVIANALNRSTGKVHIHKINGEPYYDIMNGGKKLITLRGQERGVDVRYFEPGRRFEGKRIVFEDLLKGLKGELKIVDPFCSEGALDLLHNRNRKIQFLTRMDNLDPKARARVTRAIADFKNENLRVELRDYKNKDIHDRYIISDDSLVLLGHGLSDLGGKESFAVAIDRKQNSNVVDAMLENFNRRWKGASAI